MTGKKRHIVVPSRRSGFGTSRSRVVEVVHVQGDRARLTEDQPRPAPWGVRVETWPDGLRVKPAPRFPEELFQPAAPVEPEPVVHVIPRYTPLLSPHEPPPVEQVEPVVRKRGRPRKTPIETPPVERVVRKRGRPRKTPVETPPELHGASPTLC
jgi:hypothetical protein